MVKVEIKEANGVGLRTDGGLWIGQPLNDVAWQVQAQTDHFPTKAELREVVEVMWEETPAKKLFAFIPAASADIIAVLKSIGFKQEGRMKNACESGDLIIVGRLR